MLFFFGGTFAGLLNTLMLQSANMSRAQERAAQMGGAVASIFVYLIGIVLIVMHFVRKKKK